MHKNTVTSVIWKSMIRNVHIYSKIVVNYDEIYEKNDKD